MLQDDREFIYRIDAEARITFANPEWYDFARENGVATLRPDLVLGLPLWGFISNIETRHLYNLLLKKVRETGCTVALPYRCDSPDRRRFMEMRITRFSALEVEFRSRILRQELRAPVQVLEQGIERTKELLIMCGWCKKVSLPDGRWVEVEEAVAVLNLFNASPLPGISHSMCEGCSKAFARDVEGLP